MRGTERRLKIVERVSEQQPLHVSELAAAFGVSEMTIRRDIHRLERDGFLRRTYGGATTHLTGSFDLGFNGRSLQHARQKREIARCAVELLDSPQSVYIGIGTTAEQFARFLPARPEMTVVTSSLPIASMLGTRPVRVLVAGGEVRRNELSCVGPAVAEAIRQFYFDVAVIGTAGITAKYGITDLNDAEAAVNKVAIERANEVIVLADGSKFGYRAMAFVAPVERADCVVTDGAAPPEALRSIAELGVRVFVSDETSDVPSST